VCKKPKRTLLTRKDFLRAAGAGAAEASLLGAAGCSFTDLLLKPPDNRRKGKQAEKNAIVVIIDSLRKDHIGAYGAEWAKTPSFDALAEESLLFSKAHPDAMPTIPARRAIHTGFRTWPTRPPHYGWTPIPEDQATLAEILKSKGCSTYLVTDTYLQWRRSSMNFGRGFEVYRRIRGQEGDHYKDPSVISEEWMRQRYLIDGKGTNVRQHLANVQGSRKSEEDWFAPKVFNNAIEVLEEAQKKRDPFFMVVDCFDPHEPWDPPEDYIRFYDPDGYTGKEPINDNYGPDDYLTNKQLLRMRARYSAEVTMADRWLGEFLEKAHDLGVMENTLLIVISDHGHAFGEHGYTGKPPYALWPELTDIVFIVRHPEGKEAGMASDFYVSTHDVVPTVLGFLDLKPPQPLHGQDLSVLFDGGQPEARPHFTLGYGAFVCARDEHYVMFCRNDGAGARLYDVRTDPLQQRDLAEDDSDTVEKMFEEYVVKDIEKARRNH
jgi:arylsulfatase A-like enzyme